MTLGASPPPMQAAADARTQCAFKRHRIDPHGDHVLTCKKLTGMYIVVYWLLNIETPPEQLVVILAAEVVCCERVKC